MLGCKSRLPLRLRLLLPLQTLRQAHSILPWNNRMACAMATSCFYEFFSKSLTPDRVAQDGAPVSARVNLQQAAIRLLWSLGPCFLAQHYAGLYRVNKEWNPEVFVGSRVRTALGRTSLQSSVIIELNLQDWRQITVNDCHGELPSGSLFACVFGHFHFPAAEVLARTYRTTITLNCFPGRVPFIVACPC